MKTIIDAQGNRMTRAALEEKIAGVLAQLHERAGNAPGLMQLAEVLRDQTPHSFFIAPASDQLVVWVERYYEFLRRRESDSQFEFIPQPTGGGFLLSLTDDAPFVLHSLQLCVSRLGIQFQVVCHPILRVERQDGLLQSLAPAGGGSGDLESFVVLELEPGVEIDRELLLGEIEATVQAVQQVRRDRGALEERVRLLADIAPVASRPFWDWLLDDNFVLFSYKRIRLGGEGQIDWACEEPDSALGLTWEVVELVPGQQVPLDQLNQRFRGRMQRPTRIVVEEVDRHSPIYRDRHLTSIGCRETTPDGEIEHTLLGLFTPKASEEPTLAVPALRARIEKALENLAIPVGCHDYRKTLSIFNSFPKVELFFMADEEILAIVRSFTNLYRYGVVKVVPAHSLTVRGLTLLVIMPAEFYSASVVERMEVYLRRFFGAGEVDSRVIHLSSDYLSLQFSVQLEAFDVDFDVDRLERGLTSLCRPWISNLRQLLSRRGDPQQRQLLWKRYGNSFPEEYQQIIHPRYALRDIDALERLLESERDAFDLWGPFSQEGFFRLQYYSLGKSYLNDLMPYLDNLGLRVIDEVDFSLNLDGREVFIKSFTVRGRSGSRPLTEVREHLLQALDALRSGELENDPLNRLLLSTGLAWQQIDVFRAYRNYYFQLGSPFTKLRVANALVDNPEIALLLWRYFLARFEPGTQEDLSQREEEALMPLRLDLLNALQQVRDVNADTILRILFNLIDSTVRTNFFLRQERDDYFVSFKISAIGIIDMPAPRPLFETYVHSARMEGIHLRGGKVARGGIRWSDRPDDFRTEILGLMKTQMTKNALIVPVGSKGGFIVKTPFTTREQGLELSRAAYQTLMRGLLDLCDNRVGQEIVRPQGVLAYDGDDPYLVVAADKGTAHLPDTANAISGDYGFWLKDAFASGGSKGYDHKKLGITARGAWECVKRHFRELGTDIQNEPFTVVGIGDMSGDVFGNGMLLSREIRLLAAFDHRHIFLDPDPDPAASWQERQRLFELPRSSWDDYDRSLISAGGGVFSRSDKEITLSPEVQAWLGVRHESIDPEGLISLLLVARVDLLWNGGIGTYVKASFEKHSDAGDRANDGLRIDATALHARVIGEGGNLGLTQKARIEYALGGGRINTDAIDNSAGVDCSDHEVNLKIFLHHLMETGVVGGEVERDQLLAEMTEEVCLKVLSNNYTQSLSLSLDQLRCQEAVGDFLDLTQRLVDAGLLDRGGESLPGTKAVMARPGQTLARPELSILLAYSKMQLYQVLLESELPDNPGVHDLLVDYFPHAVQQQFAEQISGHPLAREIAATMITNYLVDRAGASFCDRLVRSTGATLPQVVRAYLALDRTLGAEPLRRALLDFDNRVATDVQYGQLLAIESCLADLVQWALTDGFELSPEAEAIERLRSELAAYQQARQAAELQAVSPAVAERLQQLTTAGLDQAISQQLSFLEGLGSFLPVVALSRQSGQPVAQVTLCYHQVWSRVELSGVLQTLGRVPLHDQWDRMAARVLAVQFDAAVFDLVSQLLSQQQNVETFLANRRVRLQGYHGLRQRLAGSVPGNLHPFTVLLGALRRLIDRH